MSWMGAASTGVATGRAVFGSAIRWRRHSGGVLVTLASRRAQDACGGALIDLDAGFASVLQGR